MNRHRECISINRFKTMPKRKFQMKQQKSHAEIFYRLRRLLDRVDPQAYPLIMAPPLSSALCKDCAEGLSSAKFSGDSKIGDCVVTLHQGSQLSNEETEVLDCLSRQHRQKTPDA